MENFPWKNITTRILIQEECSSGSIKLQLTSDVVTNLQYQIDQVKERVDAVEEKVQGLQIVTKTYVDIITESRIWSNPRPKAINVSVMCFGGGSSLPSTGSGGGAGGHMATWSGSIPAFSNVNVTIGEGGTYSGNRNGGTTSFGTYKSANGGAIDSSLNNAACSGGTGGGGGGHGSYGGGGGGDISGASRGASYGQDISHGVNGGNGGTYGGGGGATGVSAWYPYGNSDPMPTGSAGGSGGTHGGNGGNGAYFNNTTNPSENGYSGTNTSTNSSLEFKGAGTGGTKGTDAVANNVSISPGRQNTYAKGGAGGGGGYGGNGGNGGNGVTNITYANTSNCSFAGSGGGGGGYGANGGNASTASTTLPSLGGGGGGYGGNGGNAGYSGQGYGAGGASTGSGGGGGGYGKTPASTKNYQNGRPGVCIIRYTVKEIMVE